MPNKLNIGIAGLGYIGKKHIECYSKIDNANIVAAVDVNYEKIKKTMGYKFTMYKTLDEMLEKEKLDVVDVCLPTALHKDAVIKALEHKINVIVEKPFALDTKAANEMTDCAIKNKKRLMIAHVCRFSPEYNYIKAIVKNNTLGKPLFYYACRNSATPTWSSNNWLANEKISGGTIMDLQIHDIDVANWLFGEPSTYKMIEVNNPLLGTLNFSHVVSTINYKNGVVAVLEAGHLMPQTYPFTTAYRLICENGVVEFNKAKDVNFVLYTGNKITDLTQEYKEKYSNFDPYLAEIKDFVDSVINNTDFKITPKEASDAVYTVNKLRESVSS